MSTTPPLLVNQTLLRVMRIARLDGLSVLMLSGLFALLSAGAGDIQGALIGVTVALAGALELHGVAALQHRDPRGINWLVGSQLFLLGAVVILCAWRLTHVDLGQMRQAFESSLKMPLMQKAWAANQEAGMTEDVFLRQTYTMGYFALALATLLYQGSMAVYYTRRREAVTRALAEE